MSEGVRGKEREKRKSACMGVYACKCVCAYVSV